MAIKFLDTSSLLLQIPVDFFYISDLTLIELTESDGIAINIYLELDNNLFKKEIKAYYENIDSYCKKIAYGED